MADYLSAIGNEINIVHISDKRNKMKRIIKNICGLSFIFLLMACEQDSKETFPDIRIGRDEVMTEVELNKQAERNILLSGGNGKYRVNVADSKVAKVYISLDTLKIKGLLEGETYATVISYGKKAKLKINVTFPKPGFSQSSILLRPGGTDFSVSLTGGGEKMKLVKDDPDEVVSMKWDAGSNIIELLGHCEGEATIIAVAEDGNKEILQVIVKVEDTIEHPGVYATTQRYFQNSHLAGYKMVVFKEGKGVWFVNSARPYSERIENQYDGTSLFVYPTVKDPVAGESVEVNIEHKVGKPAMKPGKYKMKIEEVRESTVLLHARGFKILMPFEKTK